MRVLTTLAATCLAVAVVATGAAPTSAGIGLRHARAVDGDTIQLSNGQYVRLLGYDTPEVGDCGYSQATAKMTSLLQGGVRLANRSGRDRYGRILAYVRTDEGWDIGTAMLHAGLATARYDSRDGYNWHPKEKKYHRLDAKNGKITCRKYPKNSRPRKTPDKKGVYYVNCDAAKRAGAAPVRRGDPGYGPHLDRDGDGVGCE